MNALRKWLASLCPQHGPAAYRRGRQDALAAIRLVLDPDNPCHDRVRAEIDRRLAEHR